MMDLFFHSMSLKGASSPCIYILKLFPGNIEHHDSKLLSGTIVCLLLFVKIPYIIPKAPLLMVV